MQLSIQRPYFPSFISFTLYLKSAKFYESVRELLILPSCRWLRHLSSSVSSNIDLDSSEYLAQKAAYLQEKDMYVNLVLDTIHVKPQLSYKNSRLTGCDDDNNLATSVHCFMISSLMLVHDIVNKVGPSKNHGSKPVLHNLSQAGYRVVSIITDGNRINKKLFCLLSCCNNVFNLPSFIENPFDITQKIFMLFDFVHILKRI